MNKKAILHTYSTITIKYILHNTIYQKKKNQKISFLFEQLIRALIFIYIFTLSNENSILNNINHILIGFTACVNPHLLVLLYGTHDFQSSWQNRALVVL